MDQHVAATKAVVDVAAVSVAISTPLWLEYVVAWGQPLLILGGFVILAMRFVVARRDLRDSRRRVR